MYDIVYGLGVEHSLEALSARKRKEIRSTIREQLLHEPTRQTRNKKIVKGLAPSWEHQEPLWELRIDEYRVFYDVDIAERQVTVRAVRHKPPHKTTEEIV